MLGVVVDIDGSMDFLQGVEMFLDDIKVVLVVSLQVDGPGNILQS